MFERMASSMGRDPERSGEKARSEWITQGEIQMDQAEGGFFELLELDRLRAEGQSII